MTGSDKTQACVPSAAIPATKLTGRALRTMATGGSSQGAVTQFVRGDRVNIELNAKCEADYRRTKA
jgi:hypothetical protein